MTMKQLAKSTEQTIKETNNFDEVLELVTEVAQTKATSPEAVSISRTAASVSVERLVKVLDEGKTDYKKELADFTKATEAVMKIQETAGRALRATRESGLTDEQVTRLLQDSGAPKEVLDVLENNNLKKAMAKVDDLVAAERAALESRGYAKDVIEDRIGKFEARARADAMKTELSAWSKAFDKVSAAQAAFMLSGVGTMGTAAFSGMFITAWRPMVKTVTGAVTLDKRQFSEGLALYDGIARNAVDPKVWTEIKKAFISGQTTITKETSFEVQAGWHGEGFASWMKSNGYKLPLHIFAAMDEGFKRINYQGAAYAQSKERLKTELGLAYKNLSPEKRLEAIDDMVSRTMKAGEGIDDYLVKYADSITFTGKIEGRLGQTIEGAFKRHPVAKALIVPFLRTPLNLLTEGIGSIPVVGLVTDSTRAKLKSTDPQVVKEVYGTWAVTGGVMAYMATQAAAGNVTGGFSKDPATRHTQQNSGIPAYSMKVGDTWYSFEKFEPLAVPLRMVADSMYTYSNSTYHPDNETQELMGVTAISAFTSILDNSALRPMTELFTALGDPKTFGRYVENTFGRLAPTAYTQAATAAGTGNLKQANDMMERLQRKFTPWQLPDKLNWVTGQPIKKIYGADPTRSKDAAEVDQISLALTSVGGVSAPSLKLGNGTEMSAKEYTKYIGRMTSVRIGGRTMQQTLMRLIDNPQWEQRNHKTGDTQNWHTTQANKIISRYKKAAQSYLLRTDRTFKQKYLERERELKQLRSGL